MNRKTITLGDFLTIEEIRKCVNQKQPWITREIIEPNMDRINKATGKENDADFLGFLAEWLCRDDRSILMIPLEKPLFDLSKERNS